MPGLDDVADFEERTQFCLEMAKKYKFRGLTRLHIAAWNKTLNVQYERVTKGYQDISY